MAVDPGATRSGCSDLGRQEQQTGFQEPVCGEARTEEPAAVRGEDRKESRSRCDLVKETRKKEGALTLCGEARKERWRKEAPVRSGDEASWRLGSTTRRRRACAVEDR